MRSPLAFILCLLLLCVGVTAQQPTSENHLKQGTKVFVAEMPDGFHEYLKAAIAKKKVPITIVTDRSAAQFEITGHSETQKAGTAKKLIMLDWRSNEQASIRVTHIESGEVVFAYSVNKVSSAHGKRSTAEACAKHLNKAIR